MGDSLMFGAYPALSLIGEQRNFETHFVGYTATGLLSGQGWWLQGIQDEVRSFAPDVVVIESCCNYGEDGPLYRDPDGSVVQPDTEAMFAAWAVNSNRAVALAGAAGAQVYWVVTPDPSPLVTANFVTRIHRFNEIYRTLGIPLVDWAERLRSDGKFARFLRYRGHAVAVRRLDGLHLTDSGYAIVAETTWASIGGSLTDSR